MKLLRPKVSVIQVISLLLISCFYCAAECNQKLFTEQSYVHDHSMSHIMYHTAHMNQIYKEITRL